MNSPSEMKARASKLRDALTAIDHQLKHTESLEVISKIEGYADWNTCTAVLTKKRKVAERYSLLITDAAALKVKVLIEEEGKPDLMLRVFVTGGGDSKFQYGFTFEELINEGDTEIKKEGVKFLIDPVSFQYLNGAQIDYTEGHDGSKFVICRANEINSSSELEARANRLRDVLADMGHRLKHSDSLDVISKVEGYTDWNTLTTALTTKQHKSPQKQKSEILHCSFCGKSQHDVLKLIAGPAVQICDECTDLCVDIVKEERSEKDKEKNTDADKLK